MNLTLLVGARPNFMKAAPILREVAKRDGVTAELVHSGQHYDAKMSDVFFEQLGLPRPDVNLGVGSGSHAEQTAAVMVKLEKLIMEKDPATRPDWLVVVGDVNSTMAGAIAAAKLHVRVAHVEAGLRSFDREMPEEINRMVTDAIADLLLTTEEAGNANLKREGHPDERVVFVGNVMIDTLRYCLASAQALDIRPLVGQTPSSVLRPPSSGTSTARHDPGPAHTMDVPEDGRRKTEDGRRFTPEAPPYALLTMHRPSNVDDKHTLTRLVGAFEKIAADIRIVFPAHPRTRKRLDEFGLTERMAASARIIEPVGYIEMLALQKSAQMLLTDSGGMQEESTVLGVPCLTMRNNTERPCTLELGTSELVGNDTDKLLEAAGRVLDGTWKTGRVPPLWDGRAAERIVDALVAR